VHVSEHVHPEQEYPPPASVLCPFDLISLPRRGPVPVIKAETLPKVKVMEDVEVPLPRQMATAPENEILDESGFAQYAPVEAELTYAPARMLMLARGRRSLRRNTSAGPLTLAVLARKDVIAWLKNRKGDIGVICAEALLAEIFGADELKIEALFGAVRAAATDNQERH
jgi:hypothetical protein